jgi:transcriptional regulator with XRE-family HTH domain
MLSMQDTYEPIDPDKICMMNNGDIPLHAKESEIAERDLDDPDTDSQDIGMILPKTNAIRNVKNPPKTELGKLFLAERAKRGWTQEEAAKHARLERREVGRLEQGVPKDPRSDKVILLSDAYGLERETVMALYSDLKEQATLERIESKRFKDSKNSAPPTELREVDLNALLHSIEESQVSQDPAQPTTDTPNELVASKAILNFTREDLLEVIETKIKSMENYELCGIATQVGFPVSIDLDDGTFRLKLAARCPLCSEYIRSDSMSVSKSVKDAVENHCDTCGTTFSLPYDKMLFASNRILKRESQK